MKILYIDTNIQYKEATRSVMLILENEQFIFINYAKLKRLRTPQTEVQLGRQRPVRQVEALDS